MSQAPGENLDRSEQDKFEQHASTWWDPDGPMRPLHDLNPARLAYVVERSGAAGKDVLDVGCGGGILAEALADEGGRVTGIDIAGKSLEVARLHLYQRNLDVNYEQVTAEEKARGGAQFDLITCMEMLEHVPDPRSVVDSIAAMLRPGGDAFFSTLNRTPTAFLLGIIGAEYVAGICPRGTHRYDRFIKPSELSEWVRGAGMEVIDISGIHYDPFSRTTKIGGRVSMNYLLHARTPGLGRN